MARKRPSLVAALSLSAMMLFALGAAPVQAGTPPSSAVLTVDRDGLASATDCDATDTMAYDTIQGAIDAAEASDTVRVCPGNYKELLTINTTKDHLSLVSVGRHKAHLIRPRNVGSNFPGLIHIEHGARGVLVQGLSLIFPTNHDNCDGSSVAAIQVDGQNASIRGNRIVSRDGDPDYSSCGYYAGIVVGTNLGSTASVRTATPQPAGSPPASATIAYNIIHDFQSFAIAAGGSNTSMDVTTNSVHFGHVGATDCPVITTSSTATGHSFSPAGPLLVCYAFGILLINGATGTIESNTVFSDYDLGGPSPTRPAGTGTTPIMGFGIVTDFGDAAGDFIVRRNEIAFNISGIVAGSTGQGVVRNNTVGYSLDAGIDLSGSGVKAVQNALFEADLFAESDSSGNLIRHNTVDQGRCDDDSTGPGTGGTANTWMGNTAMLGSDPPEICPEPTSTQN